MILSEHSKGYLPITLILILTKLFNTTAYYTLNLID